MYSFFVKKCGQTYENLNCRYEGVKFAYLSDFLSSRRYDFITKIFMSADARMARKLNSGTFDVKQYAEHPPVMHLWFYKVIAGTFVNCVNVINV